MRKKIIIITACLILIMPLLCVIAGRQIFNNFFKDDLREFGIKILSQQNIKN